MKHVFPLILFLIVIVAVNVIIGPPRSSVIEHTPEVDLRWQRMIDQLEPQVVLLGNSMLGEGIDNRKFSELIGRRSLKIYTGGSASAMWYLWLKNQIAPAVHKPDCVVIFFRDQFLTIPEYRVRGAYKEEIDKYATADEPLLDRLAYLNGMDPLTYSLHQYCSMMQQKRHIKRTMQTWVKDICVQRFIGGRPGDADRVIAYVFQESHLSPELATAKQLEAERTGHARTRSFDVQLRNSFLPYMIEIARENDIQLVFVRVKRRRDAEGRNEPEHLKIYLNKLHTYLNSKGFSLLDFTHDERITLDYFGSGDHLSKPLGQELFTRLLAQRLSPLMQTGHSPAE